MLRLSDLLRALHQADVRFVVVGGVAMVAHGSAHVTQDLNVCYDREAGNLGRLAGALAPLKPHLRLQGEPQGLPFLWDVETLLRGMNFTLTTPHGDLDLLGEITGLGSYERVRQHAEPVTLFGHETWIVGLRDLIASKRAAARPKDLRQIPELRALLALQERDDSGNEVS